MTRIALFCSALLLLAACTSVKQSGTTAKSTPVSLIGSELAKRSQAFFAFTASGSLISSADGQTQRGNFEMSMYKTDSLLISLYAPFGNILIGKLQATPDFFLFYNVFNNEVYEGVPHSDNMKRIVRIPLSHLEMARLMRGETPDGFDGFRPFDDDQGREVYVRKRESIVERVLYSREHRAITQYARKAGDGTTLVAVNYSDFQLSDGLPIAKKMDLRFPSANVAVTLECSDVQVNRQAASYVFSVPAGIKRNRY